MQFRCRSYRVPLCDFSTAMAIKRMSISALLLGILAASVASAVFGQVPAPKPRIEGPPARFEPCKKTYGPWPPQIPAGSQGFSDGQHANMSQFLLSFSATGIKGIKTEWVDFLLQDQSIPSFTSFQHGTVTGKSKATFKFEVRNPNNTPFVQVQGTYTKAGLDSITLIDSNNNSYMWGQIDPIPGVPARVSRVRQMWATLSACLGQIRKALLRKSEFAFRDKKKKDDSGQRRV